MVFDGPAWNKCTTSIIAAARAHTRCVMLDFYDSSVRSIQSTANASNVAVLAQLGDLWAVEALLSDMGGVLESRVLQPAEVCTPFHGCPWQLSATAQPHCTRSRLVPCAWPRFGADESSALPGAQATNVKECAELTGAQFIASCKWPAVCRHRRWGI